MLGRIALQAQPAGIGKRLEARCLTKTTILPTPRILWVGRIVKGLNVCNRNLFYNYFLSLNRLSLLFPGNNVHARISTNRQLSRFLTRRHALLLQLTAIAGTVDAIPEKVAEFEIFSVFTSYFSKLFVTLYVGSLIMGYE